MFQISISNLLNSVTNYSLSISSNFNAKTSLTAALTRSNCNKKGGIAKPENEKFKGVVKTASKKIEPKARSRVKKLAIRSKQKHPQVQKNRQQETKSSRGCDKPTQKLNFQKPRSKLTCRSPYVGELETANVIGDAICVPHEYAENESSDNKAKLRRRNLNKETLNCGCVRMTGRKATNKTSQLFKGESSCK